MPSSAAFDHVCTGLEQNSILDRLEARGTVRIALKAAGLDAANVAPQQMSVVLEKVLPGELEARGLEDPGTICQRLSVGLDSLESGESPSDTPDAVFARLGAES